MVYRSLARPQTNEMPAKLTKVIIILIKPELEKKISKQTDQKHIKAQV